MKRFAMTACSRPRVAWLVPLILICLLVAGCSSNPKDLIEGKWQLAEGGNATAEFADGVATIREEAGTTMARYEWVGDQTINIAQVGKVEVAVGRGELTLSFPGGRIKKFKRVK